MSLDGYTTYYFDSNSGNDNSEGLGDDAPKKTLGAAVNIIKSVKADSPTRVLFKAGSEYSGPFTVSGFKAADETPLIIGVYGETEDEKYVKISGGVSAVEVVGSNVRVSGIEATSPNGSRGFYVHTAEKGAMKNVVLTGNYIHDVNFKWAEEKSPEETDPSKVNVSKVCANADYTYSKGGIFFTAATETYIGESWFENVWVENNLVERTSRVGMFVDSQWAHRPGHDWGRNHYYDDDTNWFCHKNFNVRGNDFRYTGGDGMVLLATDGGYIENNTCFHAQYLGRSGYYNAGIWVHSCKNIVFQNNEAAYTFLRNGAGDGQGFDIDIGNENILFQYNYSHHNEGGGILLCNLATNEVQYDKNGDMVLDEDGLPITKTLASLWDKVTVRNNVFAHNAGSTVRMGGAVDGIDFVNNTVIQSSTKRMNIVSSGPFGPTSTPGKNWRIMNNIFVLKSEATVGFDISFGSGVEMSNNVFFGYEEKFVTEIAVNKDYLTVDPGLGDCVAENGLDGMKAFIPTNGDLMSAGVLLKNMSEVDYSGNSAKDVNYVGAFCKAK